MADETGADSSSKPEAAPEPTSLRREKATIEGEVVSESVDAQSARSEETAAKQQPSSAEGDEIRDEQVAQPRPRRASAWSIAAAIVIGAGIAAAAGAFLLRTFDTTSDTVAALAQQNKELAARLTALEKKPDAGASLRDALANQDKRLAAVEHATQEAVTTAKAALAAAEAAKPGESSTSASPTVDTSALEARIGERIGELERRLADIDQKLAQLSEPKTDVRVLEDKAVQASAESEAGAVAIIASSLLNKVERGFAYAPELAALASHGVDKSKLAVLEPTATTGVATVRALATQFAALSDSLVAPEPEKTAEEDGSFIDRLLRSASKLVRIRKVGETSAGEGQPAAVARIKAALANGSVEEALAQWNELPDAAKAKSQGFAEALKARLDAVNAARGIEAQAVAALGKTKS